MAKPLSVQALEILRRDHKSASETREAHLGAVKGFAKYVDGKFGLENIHNLKPGHVKSYIDCMKNEGLSNGTICNRLAAIRDLAEAINKPNIVARTNTEYEVNRQVRSKPLSENLTKVSEIRSVLEDRSSKGDRVAMMCNTAAQLRAEFGLRAKESLMSSRIAHGGKFLIVDGAKGGRERILEVRTDAQARAVASVVATSHALGSKTGRIIPPEMSLKAAYNAQRTLWRELGGTREHGANMHTSRHTTAKNMKANGATNGEIMSHLGHGEQRSPSFYIPK